MLAWGTEWLSSVSNWTTQEVKVTTGELIVPLDATLCDEAGRLLPGAIPTKTEHTKFLFESADVAHAGITFIRNTLIEWTDPKTGEVHSYKVVVDGNKFWTYNDSYQRKIVVSAKHVSLSDS